MLIVFSLPLDFPLQNLVGHLLKHLLFIVSYQIKVLTLQVDNSYMNCLVFPSKIWYLCEVKNCFVFLCNLIDTKENIWGTCLTEKCESPKVCDTDPVVTIEYSRMFKVNKARVNSIKHTLI